MKQKISIITIITLLLTLLFGCSQSNGDTLIVYIVQEDALYDAAMTQYFQAYPKAKIKVKYFETYEEVNARLQTELMTGEGPDVLLFNSLYSDVDPYKMAKSGIFLPLDEQVASLESDAYFTKVLDAGKVNGQQYYLPLSWNILQSYSFEDTVQGMDVYSAIETEAEVIRADATLGLSTFQFFRDDWMNLFMEIAGNEMFDAGAGALRDQKEAVQQTAEFLKLLYDNYDKSYEVGMKYNSDFTSALVHISFMLENFSFLTHVRFYETLYQQYTGQSMGFSTFGRQDGEGITAQVIQYGAINANTENAGEAWQFLQSILDVQASVNFARTQMDQTYYTPVNKGVYEECVNMLTFQQGPTAGKKKVGPLSTEKGDMLRVLPERIHAAVIPNLTFGAIVQECMEPYLQGEASFDGCYDTLVQRTKLYLSE